jgi:hypothetical protein
MTVIPIRFGTPAVCNVCGRETGNLARHRALCARKHGRPAINMNVGPEEERLIERAGTHAIAEAILPPALRWKGNVTDLDIARIVYQVEKGTIIKPSSTSRTWVRPEAMPKMGKFTMTINEGLRLNVFRTAVEPIGRGRYATSLAVAPTHARSATDREQPACRVYRPLTRWRLLDVRNLTYVDCQACMDVPMSGIYRPREQ